jgi:hypothetical protein
VYAKAKEEALKQEKQRTEKYMAKLERIKG